MSDALRLDALADWVHLSPGTQDDRVMLERLVARLRGGDDRVLERVVRELVPSVRRWAYRLLGPHPELDDAIQDSLAEIASALPRFEGRSSVATLSHRIVVRTVARYYGRRRARGDHDVETLPDETSCPERALSSRQRVARLYAHLDALSEPRRTAFVLCAMEEMSPSEAAAIVGCTPLAMRSRLFDARRELEARIAKDAALRRER
ncbi:RNA polymerase sigma factor [Sandaracinus amylolyticus]|nr:RNA polymerase sigma factor [Sandaracinus amylolyticus]